MFIYQSHLGGLYATNYKLDWDELYCDECGDSDTLFGEYEDPYEFWNDFQDEGYDEKYVMEFIQNNFYFDEDENRVYLICKDRGTGKIFVNFKPRGYEFGERHQICSSFCLKKELEEDLVASLIPWVDRVIEVKKIDDFDTCSLYQAIVDKDKDDAEDTASYMWDGWYGYISMEDYKPVPSEAWIKEVYKEK